MRKLKDASELKVGMRVIVEAFRDQYCHVTSVGQVFTSFEDMNGGVY
jgi:hypothetical protein